MAIGKSPRFIELEIRRFVDELLPISIGLSLLNNKDSFTKRIHIINEDCIVSLTSLLMKEAQTISKPREKIADDL